MGRLGLSVSRGFAMAADTEGSEVVWDTMWNVCNSSGSTAEESFLVAWGLGSFREKRGIAFKEWLKTKRRVGTRVSDERNGLYLENFPTADVANVEKRCWQTPHGKLRLSTLRP